MLPFGTYLKCPAPNSKFSPEKKTRAYFFASIGLFEMPKALGIIHPKML